jgi:hypothetical protein
MARKSSNRGKKVGPRVPIKHDYDDARRLLCIFGGNLEKMIQWFKEEIVPSPSPEDFDNAFLPGLAFMEEQFWKHQRRPENKRVFRQRILELRQQEKDPAKRIKGRINYPFTREEIIRHYIVEPAWEHRKELGLGGGTKKAVVKRLVRKLRESRYKAPN